ncbi:hypothetical protein AMECASPLE_027550 [Ameca splendens]|uniref:Palmdelphin n=1 Tax=Ameca splendens TaxID=208324 RepID=A0ABV0ZE45_9TELE
MRGSFIHTSCQELNAEFQTDVSHSLPKIQDIPLVFPQTKAKCAPLPEANSAETKPATFAIKISVEHNKRTGKNVVISTTTISPESIQEKGLKVYDDGRKSVYALQPEEDKIPNEVVGELSSPELEELLHQATDETVPAEVHYHHPVYSVPYTEYSRISTPRAPVQVHLKEKMQLLQDQQDQKSLPKLHQDCTSRAFDPDEEANLHCFSTVGQYKKNMDLTGRSNFGAKTTQEFTNSKADTSSAEPGGPVPFTVRSEGMPASMPNIHWGLHGLLPSLVSNTTEADETLIDFHLHQATESTASVNLINNLPKEQEEEPVTMVFIGYENALDKEEDDIQAELVIIDDSDVEDDHDQPNTCLDNLNYREECLSFHPKGCRSKVFQPKVGIAKVGGGGDGAQGTSSNWMDLELPKPTFIHKPGKHTSYMQGQSLDEPANRGCISVEKFCSIRR